MGYCHSKHIQEFITSQKIRIILHTQELHRIKKIVVERPWGCASGNMVLGSSVDQLLVQTQQSKFWYKNGSNDRSDSIVRKVKEAKVLIGLFGKQLLVQTRQSEFWYENGSYDSNNSIVRKVNRVLGMIEANLL